MKKPNLTIPKKVNKQILMSLRTNYRISTEQMLNAVWKEVHFNRQNKADRTYWLGKCQQLMTNIRDDDGYRMVFNIPAHKSVNRMSEYVLVAACTDPNELSAIRYRLRGNLAGLEDSIAVIDTQLGEVEKICKQLDAVIDEIGR